MARPCPFPMCEPPHEDWYAPSSFSLLEIIIFAFLFLTVVVFAMALIPKKSKKKEAPKPTSAVLTVQGENKSGNKLSGGNYQFTFDELKTRRR